MTTRFGFEGTCGGGGGGGVFFGLEFLGAEVGSDDDVASGIVGIVGIVGIFISSLFFFFFLFFFCFASAKNGSKDRRQTTNRMVSERLILNKGMN